MSLLEDPNLTTNHVELLRAACCVAAVGGSISPREMQLLRGLVESAGVGEASFYAMVDRAVNEPGFYREQLNLVKGDIYSVIRTLVEIAAADEEICREERCMLRHFAEKLGMGKEALDQILTSAKSASRDRN